MPPATMMNRNGLVTKIQSRIRSDPFGNSYSLVPGKELGRGKFAVVKKCVEKSTGNEYAAKFLRKRRKGEDCRVDIINEIAVLEMAKASPHVVTLHEVYETNTEIILVLEYAAGGEIFNQCVADQDEAFTEKDVIRLIRQILNGVAFLHRNNVVHLDLKPQNILLTRTDPLGDIRIVDFGLSRRVDSVQEVREIIGTPEYVAPEILNYEPISTATDMWSIGVLTYVMLTGESPFLGDNKQETFLNISKVDVSYSQDVFEGISESAVEFVKSLLIKNPRRRAKAEQCLNHPWLSSDAVAPEALQESPAEQSELEPGSPESSGELVLMASYTINCPCRQLDSRESAETDLNAVRKQFTNLQEIQQELVC
ncbi:serine/threonine kinase 17a like [Latimeria chalumnae]|uniref:Serine/threonine-protein kinase 17A n=1 Tax=Latimeria chalumnae TaxID=7897 RepID=H3AH43_LATCH|nr:PREDICTED: serine/threonine-protein kinase 17A [Latimeria chalumnae]|eukprot:XP_006004315.1 PREDICTED: serine/threonine-protein kinase 17A [Latimeria chalumnae]